MQRVAHSNHTGRTKSRGPSPFQASSRRTQPARQWRALVGLRPSPVAPIPTWNTLLRRLLAAVTKAMAIALSLSNSRPADFPSAASITFALGSSSTYEIVEGGGDHWPELDSGVRPSTLQDAVNRDVLFTMVQAKIGTTRPSRSKFLEQQVGIKKKARLIPTCINPFGPYLNLRSSVTHSLTTRIRCEHSVHRSSHQDSSLRKTFSDTPNASPNIQTTRGQQVTVNNGNTLHFNIAATVTADARFGHLFAVAHTDAVTHISASGANTKLPQSSRKTLATT